MSSLSLTERGETGGLLKPPEQRESCLWQCFPPKGADLETATCCKDGDPVQWHQLSLLKAS